MKSVPLATWKKRHSIRMTDAKVMVYFDREGRPFFCEDSFSVPADYGIMKERKAEHTAPTEQLLPLLFGGCLE